MKRDALGDDDRDHWLVEGEGPAPRTGTEEERLADAARSAQEKQTRACLRCGGPMESMGIVDLRVGGTTGKWKLLVGEWAELGEGLIHLELRACPRCSHVEFRLPA